MGLIKSKEKSAGIFPLSSETLNYIHVAGHSERPISDSSFMLFVNVGAAQKQQQEHVKQKLRAVAALTIKLLEETGTELNSWGSHEVAKRHHDSCPCSSLLPLAGFLSRFHRQTAPRGKQGLEEL